MYRSVFLVFDFRIFLSPCSWNRYFFQIVCRVECNGVSDSNAKVDKRKHYDLRLRDPDDAEQLK
jgi:hypothetical protein